MRKVFVGPSESDKVASIAGGEGLENDVSGD